MKKTDAHCLCVHRTWYLQQARQAALRDCLSLKHVNRAWNRAACSQCWTILDAMLVMLVARGCVLMRFAAEDYCTNRELSGDVTIFLASGVV